MKKLGVYYIETYGEAQLFFNGDECMGAVSSNDADWRHEYFNPIMKLMGLEVVCLNKLNKKQLASAKKECPEFFEE